MLGHAYWLKRFNGDPSVVGKAVLVNGKPFTVAGIVPAWFQGPYTLIEFDGYLPMSMKPADEYKTLTTKRDEHALHLLGHVKRDLTRAQAQAAVTVLASQLERQYPDTNKTVRMRVIPERLARPEANSADKTPAVAATFLVLVGLVLMVACVNVINLILVRATVRYRADGRPVGARRVAAAARPADAHGEPDPVGARRARRRRDRPRARHR